MFESGVLIIPKKKYSKLRLLEKRLKHLKKFFVSKVPVEMLVRRSVDLPNHVIYPLDSVNSGCQESEI